MDEHSWRQLTIAYPGRTSQEGERQALAHLGRVLPAAENAGLIREWWYIRKGAWRVRYLPADDPDGQKQAHRLLTAEVAWTRDIYEPETHAFGGEQAMTTAHTLFHHDSRHLLGYLQENPADRRERSLILCTALMRAAAMDIYEQGDVWARVVEHRAGHLQQPPDPRTWAAFTSDVRHLLTGTVHATGDWHAAFEAAGTDLRHLRDSGKLTRGLRAVITQHVIFHWNRLGLPAATQAALARAAKESIFSGELAARPGMSR